MFANYAPMPEVSRVLAICPRQEDRVRLHEILRGYRFRLDEAVTGRDRDLQACRRIPLGGGAESGRLRRASCAADSR